MRTWRVGTISMGASLLLLGIVLLLSKLVGLELIEVMISWWPIILIVLGIEILTFLFLSKQEKPFIKYDFLSIIFVGIIGSVGIGFALLSSTGLLESIEDALSSEQRTYDLPPFSKGLNEQVKRVVLNTEDHAITVEGSSIPEVSVFGTYSARNANGEEMIPKKEDYIVAQQKGDTLFINIKELPYENTGFGDYYVDMQATVLVPYDIKLEIVGKYNPITLKPRTLKSDWIVDKAADVSIYMEKSSDIQVVEAENKSMATNETVAGNEEASQLMKNGHYKTGNGTYKIQIVQSDQVSISILN